MMRKQIKYKTFKSVQRIFPLFVMLILTGIAVTGSIAKAQDRNAGNTASEKGPFIPEERDGAEIYNLLPPDIKESIQLEAQEVLHECELGLKFSSYHNCDCIAANYITERALHPEKETYEVKYSVKNQCLDQAGIAGYHDYNCRRLFVSRKDVEPYCKCVALDIAEKYYNQPDMYLDSRYIQRLTIEAYGRCDKPL